MAWSGFFEKLLEVIDRHLGDRSRPSQIVKEAAAQSDAMRLLAEGERDAEKIRRGELDIEVPPDLRQLPVRAAEPAQQLTYGEQIAVRIVHQELRREQNLEKIAYYTSKEAGSCSVAHEGDLDDEWLTQFFKNAQDVSTDQLQRLWARLLAGEIRSPGSYSIDTIDFLRRMTSARARQIQQIGPYIFVNNMIIITEFLTNQSWGRLEFWLELDNLGIVNRDLTNTFKSARPDRFDNTFPYGDKVLICKSDARDKTIKMKIYRLTRLGAEILSLGRFDHDYQYLMSIGQEIKKQSFDVYIGDLVERLPEGIKSRNLKEIT
jgi:hypothetical protein